MAPGPGERERSAPRRARAGHTCKSKAGSSVSVRRSSSPQSAAGQTVTTRHAHRSRPLSCPTAVLADLQRCPGHHCRLGPPRRWRVVTIPRTPGPRPESPTRLNSSPQQTAWEAIRRAGTLPVASFDAGVDVTTIRSPPPATPTPAPPCDTTWLGRTCTATPSYILAAYVASVHSGVTSKPELQHAVVPMCGRPSAPAPEESDAEAVP